MTSASLIHEAGHSKPVLWDNPEGWSREGKWERGSGWGDTCAPKCDSCRCMAKTPQFCQEVILQLNKWNLKKESACNAGDPGSIPGLGRSLEKEMATHSSIFTWRILWTEEPGGLQSLGSQKVRHDWSDWACTHAHIYTFIRVYIYRERELENFAVCLKLIL